MLLHLSNLILFFPFPSFLLTFLRLSFLPLSFCLISQKHFIFPFPFPVLPFPSLPFCLPLPYILSILFHFLAFSSLFFPSFSFPFPFPFIHFHWLFILSPFTFHILMSLPFLSHPFPFIASFCSLPFRSLFFRSFTCPYSLFLHLHQAFILSPLLPPRHSHFFAFPSLFPSPGDLASPATKGYQEISRCVSITVPRFPY